MVIRKKRSVERSWGRRSEDCGGSPPIALKSITSCNPLWTVLPGRNLITWQTRYERQILDETLAVTPGPKALEAILERCGISLDRTQRELLWRYHQALRKANADLNLTRIHKFESMVLKHYVDSLLVLKYVELPSHLIDMGSGPGLPGIPLKIARPDIQMTLAEPRGSRVAFLRQVCEQLGLDRVDVYDHKLGPDYRGQVLAA